MELKFPLRIMNLTAQEAEELAELLQEQLDNSQYANEVEVEVKTQVVSLRGMQAPIPPEIWLAFIKGVAYGAGAVVGKLILAPLVKWYKKNPSTEATIKSGDKETPLKQLSNDPDRKE
jgi:hypothetical protein